MLCLHRTNFINKTSNYCSAIPALYYSVSNVQNWLKYKFQTKNTKKDWFYLKCIEQLKFSTLQLINLIIISF